MYPTLARATLISILLTFAASTATSAQMCTPVQTCGDVDDSGMVVATDALRVLRKSVGQSVTLICQCSDTGDTCPADLESCQDDLGECLALPVCGNNVIEEGEDCELNSLNGGSCETTFEADGGTLICDTGCHYDASGCYADRFDVSGPTIVDKETGLEWEKKENADGAQFLLNPRDADNLYTWASSTSIPNGTVFADFLARLNTPLGPGTDAAFEETATGCYANHCDWRLPTTLELRAILRGRTPDCPYTPCIHPEFDPGDSGEYWTLSTSASNLNNAWKVDVVVGGFSTTLKTTQKLARAVRGG